MDDSADNGFLSCGGLERPASAAVRLAGTAVAVVAAAVVAVVGGGTGELVLVTGSGNAKSSK